VSRDMTTADRRRRTSEKGNRLPSVERRKMQNILTTLSFNGMLVPEATFSATGGLSATVQRCNGATGHPVELATATRGPNLPPNALHVNDATPARRPFHTRTGCCQSKLCLFPL